MRIIIEEKEKCVLRFDKSESVIDGLITFCESKQITAAHFTGLGACGSVTLAYYDLDNKKYLDKTFTEDLEIVSLTGNVAKLKNKTVIHCHGAFGNREYQTFSGHVKELIVSATCEIHITILSGEMKRGFDPATGLNLLK